MPFLLRARAALGQRRAARILRSGLDAFLAAALAPQCAACAAVLDAPSRGPVCPTCWNLISFMSVPPSSTPLIATCCAAGDYDAPLRDVIHAFKYEGRRGLAKPLGALARQAGRQVLDGADFAIPVPLHPFKRLARGFNQAEDLAAQLGLPVARVLRRTKVTRSQTGLHAAERRRNVDEAFRMSWRHRGTRVQGAVVVLVDDVRTTGATLDACAAVLHGAGVKEVRALTVAYKRPDTAA